MTRFYGTIKGKSKIIYSERGTINSGLTVEIKGKISGLRIEAQVDEMNGKDNFVIFQIAGREKENRNIRLLAAFQSNK